jgi:hypothetical protein
METLRRIGRFCFGTTNHVTATATIVIAIVTTVYAVFSYHQWQAMLESNRINNLGVVEIQRASILFNGMASNPFAESFNVIDSPKSNVVGPGIAIGPIWSNAGSTATKNLRVFFGEPIESVTPIERPDMRIPANTRFIPIVIGPKGNQIGTLRPISSEKLRNIVSGKLHIYLWGEAHYRDIFPGTREHVTMFCQEIVGANAIINPQTREISVVGNPIFGACMIHNCIDDECSNE